MRTAKPASCLSAFVNLVVDCFFWFLATMQLKRRDVIVGVIIVVAIIDAVLLGFIHARYIRERGFDIRPRHPAVAKPAPP